MKKTLLLALALGLASASSLKALDLYITGSTAFRNNVYDACTKLYDTFPTTNGSTPTLVFGTSATGGNAPQVGADNKNTQWTMTGTVTGTISALGSTPLTIHAIFTGSVSGINDVESGNQLIFLNTDGTTKTNAPTIAFSDASSTATPYNTANTSNFKEQKVAVLPFVWVKSVAGNGLTNVTDITTEQALDIVKVGRMRLSAWSHNQVDTTNGSFVYLLNRTQDSGSRLTAFREINDVFNSPATIYNYDFTNALFFQPTSLAPNTVGSSDYGVVGAAGNGNANTNWGPGYVAGSDISTAMQYTNSTNQSISYLSFSDAKGIKGQGWAASTNWLQVISFNGMWPTADGPNLSISNRASVTNIDFTPVLYGQYPFWTYEVLILPKVIENETGQNLSTAQFGDQNVANTIIGVLNHQVSVSGGSPLLGSVENEILLSKTNSIGNTAVRLSDMHASRQTVGGLITP